MAQNQVPNTHTKQGQFVQIPISTAAEDSPSTPINQTGNSRRRRNQWLSIFLCIVFVVTGQSIARVLENFYYDQTHRSDYDEKKQQDGAWSQSLLQTIGFPLLIIPFLLFPSKKQNPPPISSDRSSLFSLAIIYACLGITMSVQSRLSALARLCIPFGFFTLIYTTQLIFTPILTAIINKTKFNRWMIISLILAIATGALTLTTSFGGEPDEAEENYPKGAWCGFFAAAIFSLILCNIQLTFQSVIPKRNAATNRKPSFAVVLELLIFVCLVAAVISAAGLLIAGEHHELKREMEGFTKGKASYVLAMAGQAAAWQIYWVGIAGLVFRVSSVFSNVISVCGWPVVSVLVVVLFDFMDDEFDAFKGAALATAVLSVGAYVYKLNKDNSGGDDLTS